ncbi:MAG: hypothetical protein J0I98_21225 [Mesorhizobium sp.]|nr:hypothetical protein [Mesorhizobium sp.]MBN9245306.1 hypothetical protein [Mesorhizobium sp.]
MAVGIETGSQDGAMPAGRARDSRAFPRGDKDGAGPFDFTRVIAFTMSISNWSTSDG